MLSDVCTASGMRRTCHTNEQEQSRSPSACFVGQVWGAPDTLTQLPAGQQAYMTAALVRMVAALGRRGVEGTPGLLPALLGGVSARLDSPLLPIR